MIEKSDLISLINSEMEKNNEYRNKIVSQVRNYSSDEGIIADANFMNGFMSALSAIKDKIMFM